MNSGRQRPTSGIGGKGLFRDVTELPLKLQQPCAINAASTLPALT